jgi:acyl-CoA thioesterase-1
MAGMNTFLQRKSLFAIPLSRRWMIRLMATAGAASVIPAWAQTPASPGASPAGSGGAASPPDQRPVLLVLGDSLSAEYGLTRGSGWVSLLDRRLAGGGRVFRIVNASISGETTAGGVTRIEGLLRRQRPAIVIIELGGNDALRGLDLTTTEANLRTMARRAREAGARVLLLGMQMPPNYGQAYGEAFARVFVQVAKDTDAALVPFFLEDIGDKLEYFQPDRIHPNESAQPLMLERVWPELQRLL